MNTQANQSVLIAGATGAIGQRVATRLARSAGIHRVHCLVRNTPRMLANVPNIRCHSVDFRALTAPDTETISTFICCLGTTIKTAGSKERFYEVDHDFVITAAKTALAMGTKRCIVISSVGASINSNSFYLKTKGEMERDLKALSDFKEVLVIRPSLLTGDREEFHPAERLGGWLSHLLNPLLMGPLAKYKSISMDVVAQAICQLTRPNSNAGDCADGSRFRVIQGKMLRQLATQHD